MNSAGLPHSEIPGSKAVCALPRLIAAYHVLLRFPEPRHPPCALRYLTSTSRFPRSGQVKTFAARRIIHLSARMQLILPDSYKHRRPHLNEAPVLLHVPCQRSSARHARNQAGALTPAASSFPAAKGQTPLPIRKSLSSHNAFAHRDSGLTAML